jgi:hypothetical protein
MGNCGGSEATKSTNEPTAVGKSSHQPKEISVKSTSTSATKITENGNGNGKEKYEEERKEDSKTVNAAKPPTAKPSTAPVRTKSSDLNQKDARGGGGGRVSPSPNPSSSPTPQQIAAVQRIQRLVRNKSAWRLAQEEREWRVRPSPAPCLLPPHLPSLRSSAT